MAIELNFITIFLIFDFLRISYILSIIFFLCYQILASEKGSLSVYLANEHLGDGVGLVKRWLVCIHGCVASERVWLLDYRAILIIY